ncbi:hypothetical protein IW261DRAFT_1422362 [Armillaria novae-zelandiae]|uniref:RNase H type-1 domain-containing protein n=1 Tax=Armillaria novae-zelandiae TaxID=153914 RepID=A0AA39UAT4_9AGAR|nr:hypothetical protein IW261DRAFT_1422362 [Armillaria novae-zelandiae]
MLFTEDGEAIYNAPHYELGERDEQITVNTDGSAVRNGARNSVAGTGVFCQEGDLRNRSIRLPNEAGTTNQVSEVVGAETAAEDVLRNRELKSISDSRHTLNDLSGRITKWENKGYFLVANSLVMQTMKARFQLPSVQCTNPA